MIPVSPQRRGTQQRFRPHVWGFFFHPWRRTYVRCDVSQRFSSPCLGILLSQEIWIRLSFLAVLVFVPMFGDSFFTPYGIGRIAFSGTVFVPMFGDSFFTVSIKRAMRTQRKFSSPCLGILFSREHSTYMNLPSAHLVFVPMFGDSFFTLLGHAKQYDNFKGVFVPMFGDSFFTATYYKASVIVAVDEVFVPMFGDSFFTISGRNQKCRKRAQVFVPMFGDSFFTAGLGDPTGWALYGPFAAGISN